MATLALIRHVTPLIDRGVCDAAEAARRAILYDTTQSLALYETDKISSRAGKARLHKPSMLVAASARRR